MISFVCLTQFAFQGLFAFTVPAYAVLLMTMAWRGVDKARSKSARRFEALAGVGAVLFAVSDVVLALNVFKVLELNKKLAQVLVMTTYYAAQWCITLTTADHCT